MALQCGTTNNGCNGIGGVIRVEYTIPDPPYVRYKYPNSDWVNVANGVNFTTEQSNPASFSGGQCQAQYRFMVKWRQSETGPWYEEIIGIRNGPITSLLLRLVSGINASYERQGFPVVEGLGRGGYFLIIINDDTAFRYGYIGIYDVGRSEFIRLVRADGLADNCGNLSGGNCTFKVFDLNNQIIYQETRDVCPTAEVMPSVYGNNKGNFNVKSVGSQPLKITENEANNIKSTLIQLGTTTVKKLDSPAGSTLFPKVCWDCESENNCPENTCSIDCGAHICCYDKNGITVKTLLKS